MAQHRYLHSNALSCVESRCSRDGQFRGHTESLLAAPGPGCPPGDCTCKPSSDQVQNPHIQTLWAPASFSTSYPPYTPAKTEHAPDAGSNDMVQLNLCAGPGFLYVSAPRRYPRSNSLCVCPCGSAFEATKLSPRNGESMMRPRE